MLIPLIKKDLTIVKGYTLGVVAIAFGLPLLLAWRQPQMGGMISLLMAVLISSVAFNLAISEKENQYPKATALLSSTPYTKGKVIVSKNVLMNEEKMNAPCAIGTKGAVTTGSEQRVPIHLKLTLTIKEAAEYSNIGINKIDTMLKQPNCPFVLYVGTRKLVKRREFEEYIRRELTI